MNKLSKIGTQIKNTELNLNTWQHYILKAVIWIYENIKLNTNELS